MAASIEPICHYVLDGFKGGLDSPPLKRMMRAMLGFDRWLA